MQVGNLIADFMGGPLHDALPGLAAEDGSFSLSPDAGLCQFSRIDSADKVNKKRDFSMG